ncbi:hypothetical protein MOJ79_18660 [Calidifontimicrobium sp. SYSU G02091]|uniref:hypothetical protein n=1 Tax=Calidifontimicrobium sp. SYSU G02091 TaxID=2926421 RepID=UPI001F53B6B7|nr:hypothetical protein [Calidifontimicrobium sp. SYSU G02091]MCI1193859.1 hypothetical protein [Calidifontimicrobium sp. SYSU G02091]
MLGLLGQFVWYVLVMAGAVFAVLFLPGWWWAVMATALVAVIALSVASGLGSRRAKRALGWLFWTDERFTR